MAGLDGCFISAARNWGATSREQGVKKDLAMLIGKRCQAVETAHDLSEAVKVDASCPLVGCCTRKASDCIHSLIYCLDALILPRPPPRAPAPLFTVASHCTLLFCSLFFATYILCDDVETLSAVHTPSETRRIAIIRYLKPRHNHGHWARGGRCFPLRPALRHSAPRMAVSHHRQCLPLGPARGAHGLCSPARDLAI